jgi:hypothetical protein
MGLSRMALVEWQAFVEIFAALLAAVWCSAKAWSIGQSYSALAHFRAKQGLIEPPRTDSPPGFPRQSFLKTASFPPLVRELRVPEAPCCDKNRASSEVRSVIFVDDACRQPILDSKHELLSTFSVWPGSPPRFAPPLWRRRPPGPLPFRTPR